MADSENAASRLERKHREAFEQTQQRYEARGYSCVDVTMDPKKITRAMTVVGTAIFLALCGVFELAHPDMLLDDLVEGDLMELLVLVAAFFVLLAVHEFIHGIGFALFSKGGFKSVSYGIIPSRGMAYCFCSEPVRLGGYIATALLPGVVLGLVPMVVALIMGNVQLAEMAILMTSCACGDMVIVAHALRCAPRGNDVLLLDSPEQTGPVAFVR